MKMDSVSPNQMKTMNNICHIGNIGNEPVSFTRAGQGCKVVYFFHLTSHIPNKGKKISVVFFLTSIILTNMIELNLTS